MTKQEELDAKITTLEGELWSVQDTLECLECNARETAKGVSALETRLDECEELLLQLMNNYNITPKDKAICND